MSAGLVVAMVMGLAGASAFAALPPWKVEYDLFLAKKAEGKADEAARAIGRALAKAQTGAKQGDADAFNLLGVCYENGHGVEQDLLRAFEFYGQAIVKGSAKAMFNVGVLYQNGGSGGKPFLQSYTQAAQNYLAAGLKGYPLGFVNLGVMHEKGIGMKADPVKAAGFYRKAAEAGHPYGMRAMGNCYHYGIGVPGNTAEARRWYQRALALGETESKAALAWLNAMEGVALPESLRLIDESLAALEPGSKYRAEQLDTRGLILHKLGRLSEAKTAYEGSLAITENATVRERLGKTVAALARKSPPQVGAKTPTRP